MRFRTILFFFLRCPNQKDIPRRNTPVVLVSLLELLRGIFSAIIFPSKDLCFLKNNAQGSIVSGGVRTGCRTIWFGSTQVHPVMYQGTLS